MINRWKDLIDHFCMCRGGGIRGIEKALHCLEQSWGKAEKRSWKVDESDESNGPPPRLSSISSDVFFSLSMSFAKGLRLILSDLSVRPKCVHWFHPPHTSILHFEPPQSQVRQPMAAWDVAWERLVTNFDFRDRGPLNRCKSLGLLIY